MLTQRFCDLIPQELWKSWLIKIGWGQVPSSWVLDQAKEIVLQIWLGQLSNAWLLNFQATGSKVLELNRHLQPVLSEDFKASVQGLYNKNRQLFADVLRVTPEQLDYLISSLVEELEHSLSTNKAFPLSYSFSIRNNGSSWLFTYDKPLRDRSECEEEFPRWRFRYFNGTYVLRLFLSPDDDQGCRYVREEEEELWCLAPSIVQGNEP